MKAVFNNIIVKVVHSDKEKVNSVIVIPDEHRKQYASYHGEVVSVGPDCPYRNEINVGDKILFYRHEGKILTDGVDEFHSLAPERILGKIK